MNGVITAGVQPAAPADGGGRSEPRRRGAFRNCSSSARRRCRRCCICPAPRHSVCRSGSPRSASASRRSRGGRLQSQQRPPAHRAYGWVAAVMGLLAVMLSNPYTASLMAGVAQMGVYFAVMSPLFWAPVFVRTPEHLARLLGIVLDLLRRQLDGWCAPGVRPGAMDADGALARRHRRRNRAWRRRPTRVRTDGRSCGRRDSSTLLARWPARACSRRCSA